MFRAPVHPSVAIAFTWAYPVNEGRWLHSFVMVSFQIQDQPRHRRVSRQFAHVQLLVAAELAISPASTPPVYPCDSWPRVRENHRAGSAIPPSAAARVVRQNANVMRSSRRPPSDQSTRCASLGPPRRTPRRSAASAPAAAVFGARLAHTHVSRTAASNVSIAAAPRCASKTCTSCGGTGSARDLACNPPCRSTPSPTLRLIGAHRWPADSSTSRPHTAKCWSRIISADSRSRGPRRQQPVVRSSAIAPSSPRRLPVGCAGHDPLLQCLTSQPLRTNSVASQSSSSGATGPFIPASRSVLQRLD